MRLSEVQARAGKWTERDEETIDAIRALILNRPKVSREEIMAIITNNDLNNWTKIERVIQIIREAGVWIGEQ